MVITLSRRLVVDVVAILVVVVVIVTAAAAVVVAHLLQVPELPLLLLHLQLIQEGEARSAIPHPRRHAWDWVFRLVELQST